MTREIIQCSDKEVTVFGDGIEYTYRLIDNPSFSFESSTPKSGFDIKIIDNAINVIIYNKLNTFIKNDLRSANLGRIFGQNLSRGSISWACYKWLNSHCYTKKTKSWLTTGQLMCDLESILFGFKLRKKLQGQCDHMPVTYTDQEVFDMFFEKTHAKFCPCPVCD
ncbi:MAG: hypothetical protein WA102_10505 [Candidatus Methanoperedens sp.]